MPATEDRVLRTLRRRTIVSRARVESVMIRFTAIGGLVFAAQSVPLAIGQIAAVPSGIGSAFAAFIWGAFVALAVAAYTGTLVRVAAFVVAGVVAVAVALWPVIVTDPTELGHSAPWVYFVLTVATTAAGLVMRFEWAVVYTLGVSALYGVVRWLPEGGAPGVSIAGLEALYAAILGMVVLLIIRMLRQAADAVDDAQDGALQRYDLAARQHATEVERVKVDALVHDSVLTSLLTAASAETDDARALATRLASDAIARIDESGAAGEVPLGSVGLTVLVRRLRGALSTLSTPFIVRTLNTGGVELPLEAVEALYTATVQSMVNSIQHAGEPGRTVRREVRVRGVRAGGCLIEVADNGVGFALHDVPSSRLGIQISVFERMEHAGGSARIDSTPGSGTTVTLGWPVWAEGRS